MTEVQVYLKDGRVIDVSGLSPEAAVERLQAEGVTPGLIEHTVHRLPHAIHSLRAIRPSLEQCMADAIEKFGGKG